jgi:hypothetical protein
MAAWLYAAARDLGRARQMLERAAERAAAGGDVERAANSYVDAALVAVQGGRYDQVARVMRKLAALLESPILPPETRDLLHRRINGSPRLAQLWGDDVRGGESNKR